MNFSYSGFPAIKPLFDLILKIILFLLSLNSLNALIRLEIFFLASGAAGGARLPPMDQAGAVAAMTDDLAYTGGDTTMPPMLTSDMGADSFIDTTPDYSLLDHSGHPMAKETVGIGTTPPDTISFVLLDHSVLPDSKSKHAK